MEFSIAIIKDRKPGNATPSSSQSPTRVRGFTKAIRDAISKSGKGDIIRIKVKDSRVIPSIRTIATRTCAELGVMVTTKAHENAIDINIKRE